MKTCVVRERMKKPKVTLSTVNLILLILLFASNLANFLVLDGLDQRRVNEWSTLSTQITNTQANLRTETVNMNRRVVAMKLVLMSEMDGLRTKMTSIEARLQDLERRCGPASRTDPSPN